MDIFSELNLRESFEVQRLQQLAARILSVSGARSMVLFLDDQDRVSVLCGTGWLHPLSDYVGDAIFGASDPDAPLSQLV